MGFDFLLNDKVVQHINLKTIKNFALTNHSKTTDQISVEMGNIVIGDVNDVAPW